MPGMISVPSRRRCAAPTQTLPIAAVVVGLILALVAVWFLVP